MKVVFPYPGYWPYVRRGVERCIHDLATYLAGRGHQVHVIATTPGTPRVGWDGAVKVTYLRQVNHPVMYRHHAMFRYFAYGVSASFALRNEKADVAHMWAYSGIRWAGLLRRLYHLPYVFHMIVNTEGNGKRWFPEVLGADQVVALTRPGALAVEEEFGVQCGVLPPPIDLARFRPVASRDLRHPTVLFPNDLADPRKGGGLLLRAWSRVHREVPSARLVLGGSLGVAGWLQDQTGKSMLSKLSLVRDPSARAAIELRGPGGPDSLPEWYSSASVTVLPSISEAFGMVLTESLACGTPVVASRHDGPGEIVAGPGVGASLDLKSWVDLESPARADELAEAILTAMELARRKGTRERCREWASQWSLDRIGPEEERMLERVIEERKTGRTPWRRPTQPRLPERPKALNTIAAVGVEKGAEPCPEVG